MNKMVITLLTALVFSLSFSDQAQAVTPEQPHSFVCAECHTPHKELGSTGYDNICLNCHRGGDPRAGAKSFAPGDAADPFGKYTSGINNSYQTSHRWDGSGINKQAGASNPIQPQMTSATWKTGGELACVRCHNPHSQENKPFLRTANGADQMCLDCHSSRNQTDHTKGTHPVGVTYPQSSAEFNATPINANPANTSSAMKLVEGKVSCSTCHGVHNSDSSSATFDSFSSQTVMKPSDGYLLRTDRKSTAADGINICTNCHTGKTAHNGHGQNVQCADCHGAHVDSGDGSTPNVWLVKREMGSGRATVQFTSTTVKNYMTADGKGVCQSCHAVPTGSGYPIEHQTQNNTSCNNCHTHGSSKGSFSAEGCTVCHGYPPAANSAGAGGYAAGYQLSTSFVDESRSGHASHASTPYQKACTNCHSGNNHANGTFQDVFNNHSTVAAIGGLNPTYNITAQTCSSVYCHSNANPRGGTNVTKSTPSWKDGKGTIIGTTGECSSCHSAAGGATPTWSVSHTKHINGYAANKDFTCNVCHAGTASGNSAIFSNMTARSLHTNGVKDVKFNATAQNGIWNAANATCSNLYCHSNVQGANGLGAGTTTTPTWNAASMTCGSCHASMIKMANISSATGSHKRHTQASGYDCSTCHGSGYSATAAAGTVNVATHVDRLINMSFTGVAATNGAVPSYYQGNNAPGSGYEKCSNVYCHSSVQGAGGLGKPAKFTDSVWGGQPLACGSCHANMGTDAAATGSHVAHAQNAKLACQICHNGAGKDTVKHANGTINISFSGTAANTTYSKGVDVTPGTGYGTGTCSNASCHADPYSSANITTAAWGSPSAGCAACHKNGGAFDGTGAPVTGSHNKHMLLAGALCSQCHDGAVAGTSGGVAHGDSNIDVTNGYPADVAKHTAGTGYSGCATSVCHGQGKPVWGSGYTNGAAFPYSTNQCDKCHAYTVTASAPFYSTVSTGKVTATTDAKVGAHTAHVTSGHAIAAALTCADCHGTVSTDTHMKGSTTFNFSALARTGGLNPIYDPQTKTCSNTYCHGTTLTGGGINKTPSWTLQTTSYGCDSCHGFPPTTVRNGAASHPTSTACNGCHTNVNVTNDGFTVGGITQHINGKVEASGGGSCNSCHGYPPAAVGFTGTAGNWENAQTENYLGGGGAHTVNSHVSKSAKASEAWANCTNCHNEKDHNMSATGFRPSQDIKITADQRLRFVSAKQFRYTSNRRDGAEHLAGTCSNVSCHFGATPVWAK